MNVETMDFIVHPDYYGMPNMYGTDRSKGYSDAYERYMGEITTVIRDASSPILLYNTELGTRLPDMSDELFERFDNELRYPTHTGTGIVHGQSNAKAILDLVEDRKPSRVVLHGSYLSMCMHQFAQGLRIAIATSEPEKLSIVGTNMSGLGTINWTEQKPVNFGTSLTLAFGERNECVDLNEVSELIPHVTTFLDEDMSKIFSARR